jgi:hypothetical protein
MFNWDGSDVTDFIKRKEIKIYEGENENKTYWLIENEENSLEEIVLAKSSTSTLPCLIDELKIIFGLEKIGTHWLKLNGKIYIISQLELENGDVLDEITLDQYKYDRNIEDEVQKIFMFRELLGLTMNFEKNILLRKKQFYIQPISFYETGMHPSKSGKVLPNTILDKWFKNTDLDSETCKFFNIDNIENMNEVLLDLKTKLEKIFNRVDPNSIMNIDEILSRIRSRLQFILC